MIYSFLPHQNQICELRKLQDLLCSLANSFFAGNYAGIFLAPSFPLHAELKAEKTPAFVSARFGSLELDHAVFYLELEITTQENGPYMTRVKLAEAKTTAEHLHDKKILHNAAENFRKQETSSEVSAIDQICAFISEKLSKPLRVFKTAEIEFTESRNGHSWTIKTEKWHKLK